MQKVLGIVIVIMAAMVCVSAQTRQDRIRFSEHKVATLKLNSPATEIEGFHLGTSYSYPVEDFKPGVVQVGPRTTYLKEGLRTDEVIRLLGKPASISERSENDIVITTYEFQRGEGRILIAEFVGGILVRSRSETRVEHPVQADR
jgi:hypothetical protein